MATMQSLHINAYGAPSTYVFGPLPKPLITAPDQILIRVYATSLNPIEYKSAGGDMKMLVNETMPMKIGFDVSGVVEEVGGAVVKFKAGDEVMTRLPEGDKGAVSEFAKTTESFVVHKPSSLSHVEAACLPLVGLTGYQVFDRAEGGRTTIKGKRVLVTGGLGGAGCIGVQIAKKLGASEVITTVSTGKLARAKEDLGHAVDKFIDYKTTDILKEIEPKSLDFIFDTVGDAGSLMTLLKPGCTIISIATLPPGSTIREHMPDTPWLVAKALDLVSWRLYRAARANGVKYDYVFMSPNGADLEAVANMGLKAVIGDVVEGYGDGAEERIRAAYEEMKSGGARKGGKIVIKMMAE